MHEWIKQHLEMQKNYPRGYTQVTTGEDIERVVNSIIDWVFERGMN
jgi:hypothetical protein